MQRERHKMGELSMPFFEGSGTESAILETVPPRVRASMAEIEAEVRAMTTIKELEALFKRLFNLDDVEKKEKNLVGIPLARVTPVQNNVTREELGAALSELAGKDLSNLIEGVTAQVNANQKRKMESAKARDKSAANGFSIGAHNSVASQIVNIWKWAAEADNRGDEKNNMPDVRIRRFVSALDVNGQDAFAWLTIKETSKGLRIYSVELMDEKKLRGSLGSGTAEAATDAPSCRSFEEIIGRLSGPVNRDTN